MDKQARIIEIRYLLAKCIVTIPEAVYLLQLELNRLCEAVSHEH